LSAARFNTHGDVVWSLVADERAARLARIATECVNGLTPGSHVHRERLLQRMIHLDSQSVIAANQGAD
jgi:hypothetical protein